MNNTLFFDSYAIIEIMKENPAHAKHTNSDSVINEFVFAELCYRLHRVKEPKAEEILAFWATRITNTPTGTIEKAMLFRIKEKTKNLSIPDCTGYMLAEKLGIKFLTGDKQFQGMKNVEFVK